MNPVLKQEFYSKLEWDESLVRKYPPDEQQQNICDRLGVSYFLWSFYAFKKKSIRAIWKPIRHLVRTENYHYFMKDFELIQRGTFYPDMKLTFDEKFFVFHHRAIDGYLRDAFRICRPALSLRNLCFDRIVQTIGDRDGTLRREASHLPKRIFHRLEVEGRVSMPAYDREGMRDSFYDACCPLDTFFAEMDTWIYSKEFVVWFQNDLIVYETFRGAEFPIKIIHFHFNKLGKRYFVCMCCMKRILEKTERKTVAFQRRYYDHDRPPRFVSKDLQNRFNWCGRCKRVPLFHTASEKDFEKRYPERRRLGYTIKVEQFM